MARKTRSRKSRSAKLQKRHGKSGRRTKRKMNEFMKTMLAAKKSKAPSFKYKGKTYKKHQKGHFVYYKKA